MAVEHAEPSFLDVELIAHLRPNRGQPGRSVSQLRLICASSCFDGGPRFCSDAGHRNGGTVVHLPALHLPEAFHHDQMSVGAALQAMRVSVENRFASRHRF